jgi:hypothetical protein
MQRSAATIDSPPNGVGRGKERKNKIEGREVDTEGRKKREKK